MTGQDWLWAADGAALALALAAGVADWRRTHRRRALEAVGWMPWREIQVVALFAVLVLAIVALHG